MKQLIKLALFCSLIVLALTLLGCSEAPYKTPIIIEAPMATPSPTPAKPQIISVDVIADPSLLPAYVQDPYNDINPYIKEIFSPNADLYRFVYKAVENMEQEADISAFDMPLEEKVQTVDCLYSESGFRFYYLRFVKVSKDGTTAKFTYYDDDKPTIEANQEAFCAHLSHLIYNVSPEYGTDIQKLFSVYSYILDHYEYSPDMSDETTWSPYSILNKGVGICGGYADLMKYVLKRQGLTIEYVSNQAHAWDIVKLDGQWYHTDVTFSVGSPGSYYNDLRYVLMDDNARQTSLDEGGIGDNQTILGYPSSDVQAPPACTDNRFKTYNTVGSFAIDADSNTVFFCDGENIKAMNLDCSNERVLTSHGTVNMAAFDGVLYYIDAMDGFLYRLAPGSEPELLDDDCTYFCYLKKQGGSLLYGEDATGIGCRTLKLLEAPADIDSGNLENDVTLSPEKTFKTVITFSEPMDTSADWNRCVFFTDADGNAYPLHFGWNSDSTQLTVRPVDDLYGIPQITVSVVNAPAANGTILQTPDSLTINKEAI